MKNGWYAEEGDTDSEQPGMWRPVLQFGGCVAELEIWLPTKAACEEFIQRDVIGVGMLVA